MITLTGVHLANKESMYEEAKHSLMQFGGSMCVCVWGGGVGGEAVTGAYIRLEPAWARLASKSYKIGCAQHGSNGVLKKKLNSLGLDGQILLY